MDVSREDAIMRYRDVNELDSVVGDRFWRAIWLEGALSPIATVLRERDQRGLPRHVVELASEADAAADVDPASYLPVHILPGDLRLTVGSDRSYGTLGRRARENVSWQLAKRLPEIEPKTLVVLGAQRPDDLSLLWDLLGDSTFRGMKVALSWPGGSTPPPLANPTVEVEVFAQDDASLIELLVAQGLPLAEQVVESSLLVGDVLVPITPKQLRHVEKRFKVLTQPVVADPLKLAEGDLEAFFAGDLDNWSAYSSTDLPVRRSYSIQTQKGANLRTESLHGRVERALRELAAAGRTIVVRLPAQAGSGATTLARDTAFHMARAGYPTLVSRPEQVDVDIEDVLAFATTLSDAAAAAGLSDLPPLLILLDTEQTTSNTSLARALAQSLATQGRKAVVLEIVTVEDPSQSRSAEGANWSVLPTLTSAVTEQEVAWCGDAFNALESRWGLGLGGLTIQDWEAFGRASKYRGPDELHEPETMFWVALRFFVCEGPSFVGHAGLQESLSGWIARRTDGIIDEDTNALLNYVAALSRFRLLSPLTTVLRPISGGRISSDVIDVLRKLTDIVDWRDYSEDLGDQVLVFRHPSIAVEFLRMRGVVSSSQTVDLLAPVLERLSPGSDADMWLAEALAALVLAPDRKDSAVDWSWRLDAFDRIPQVVRESSKAVLHHWARCLYQSTRTRYVPDEEKRARLELAVKKLEQALAMDRRDGRDEHPGYILNTLGVAYADLAAQDEKEGLPEEAEMAWERAAHAFEAAIELMPTENVISYMAFAHRLLRHADKLRETPDSTEALLDAAHALALVDTAESVLGTIPVPEPGWQVDIDDYKTHALSILDESAARGFVERLKGGERAGVGYYCEARLIMGSSPSDDSAEEAIAVLDGALEQGVELEPDGLRFLLRLVRNSPERKNDFAGQRSIYRKLELAAGTSLTLVDQFNIAVLCYQLAAYGEGKERFRRLRESVRQVQATQAPPRVHDYWRDETGVPRQAHARVERALSDWRGEGFVEVIEQTIPLRPRHFSPIARVGQYIDCLIRFEIWGPLAVPARLAREK